MKTKTRATRRSKDAPVRKAKAYEIQYNPKADGIRVWFGTTVIEMNYQGARMLAGDLLEICKRSDAPYYCRAISPNEEGNHGS